MSEFKTIEDRAAFAAAIKKWGGLIVVVVSEKEVSSGCASSYCINVPVRQALQQLDRGDFAAFVWQAGEEMACVGRCLAPLQVQLRRRRETLDRLLAKLEALLARMASSGRSDEWSVSSRDRWEKEASTCRAEMARIDEQLAAETKEPAA